MLKWLASKLAVPQPAGPPQSVHAFAAGDPLISQDVVEVTPEGWLVNVPERRTVLLFEMQNPGLEHCILTYRATMKSEDLKGGAYLEMWCRLPGRGEFFSRGLQQKIQGTTDWGSFEIPFFLKKGQRPDLIKLNLVVAGAGKIWMKDIELIQTPLA